MIVLNNTWSAYRSKLFSKCKNIHSVFYLVESEKVRSNIFERKENEVFLGRSLFRNYLTTTQDIILARIDLKLFKENKLLMCGWSYSYYWMVVIVRRLLRKRTFVLVEGIHSKRNGTIGRLWRWLIISLFNSTYVTLLSPLSATDNYIKNYGFKIPKILRLSNYSVHSQVKMKRDIDFLYVGRNSPEKNIQGLIRLARNNPEYSFSFVGDDFGDDLPANISVFKYTGNLGSFYSRSKALLLLSFYEPYGMVAIEASHCGCIPLLSHKVGCSELFPFECVFENESEIDLSYIIVNRELIAAKLPSFDISIPIKQIERLGV